MNFLTDSGPIKQKHTHKQLAAKVPLSEQVIWLSGASSGIGAALVGPLSRRCRQLIITARNVDALEQRQRLSGSNNIVCLGCDITQPDQCFAVIKVIEQRFGRLDCLIANAGICDYCDVQQFSALQVQQQLNTNVLGLAHCIEAALPLLRQSRRGHLVGMSSSVAWLALPRAQGYGSSKAAVSYLLQSLALDLAREQIDVSEICPGFVDTPLTQQNDFPMPARISAESAADEIIRGIEQRQAQIHFPKRFTRVMKLLSLLPYSTRLRFGQLLSRNQSATSEIMND